MTRPATVRDGLAGYTTAPDLAWSGWRLRIPGGPIGGQYHGFIAPDSAGWPAGADEIFRPADSYAGLGAWGETEVSPWEHEWGGLMQREGETLTDHVYRSPGEMRPRPNASGGAHVVRAYQTRRTAGFAEAPGNYRGVGGMGLGVTAVALPHVPFISPRPNVVPIYSQMPANPAPVRPVGPIYPVGPNPDPGNPFPGQICPAWGCNGPPQIWNPIWRGPGATSVVQQPPPPASPAPAPVVPVTTIPPISPAPAPTVSVSNDPQCLALGMNGGPYPYCNPGGLSPIDSMTPATGVPAAGVAAAPSSSLSDWLNQSTLISSVPNMYVAIGGAIAAWMMFKKK